MDAQQIDWLIKHLRLSAAELAAVARTGFVSSERRAKTCVIHKLRFRLEGRQRVRYLGVDRALVDAVRQELARLQQSRRSSTELRRLGARARELLRQIKPQLAQKLAQDGYRFHGLALRRRRPDRNLDDATFSLTDPENLKHGGER